MDNTQLMAIWKALDTLALELGQADVVQHMVEQNRQLMLGYLDLFRQKTTVAAAPNGKPKAATTPTP